MWLCGDRLTSISSTAVPAVVELVIRCSRTLLVVGSKGGESERVVVTVVLAVRNIRLCSQLGSLFPPRPACVFSLQEYCGATACASGCCTASIANRCQSGTSNTLCGRWWVVLPPPPPLFCCCVVGFGFFSIHFTNPQTCLPCPTVCYPVTMISQVPMARLVSTAPPLSRHLARAPTSSVSAQQTSPTMAMFIPLTPLVALPSLSNQRAWTLAYQR